MKTTTEVLMVKETMAPSNPQVIHKIYKQMQTVTDI